MALEQSRYIRKVAIVGASGQMGSHFLTSLLSTNKHSVTILTRPESTASFPSSPNVEVKSVSYNDENNLIDALRNHDFLIITLSAQSPPSTHSLIVSAAAKAGIPYILPNYFAFGIGSRGGSLASDPILSRFGTYIDDVRNVAVPEGGVKPSFVALCCGFWYEFSLSHGEPWFGFDIANRSVTFYDEGMAKINTSTWKQCGEAVAALLSLPIEGRVNGELSLEDWKDEGLYVSSFLVSQREMLDSLHRVLGTTDEDWSITKEPVRERHQEGLEQLQQGDRLGFAKAMYARLFFPNEGGDYETGFELDNGKLGLVKEDLDEATRRAVDMVGGDH